MKREILKSTQGITLIALIITIIVMLILVGVTVTTALDTKLFQQAQEATKNTQIAKDEESKIAEGKIKVGNSWVDINDYASGQAGTTGGATIDFSAKNVGDVISEYTAGGLTWRLLKKDATKATIIANAPMNFENIRSEDAFLQYIDNNYITESYRNKITEAKRIRIKDVIPGNGGYITKTQWDLLQTFGINATVDFFYDEDWTVCEPVLVTEGSWYWDDKETDDQYGFLSQSSCRTLSGDYRSDANFIVSITFQY